MLEIHHSGQGPSICIHAFLLSLPQIQFWSWSRGHNGLVNFVRVARTKKKVSDPKRSYLQTIKSNAICSHKFVGHNALASTFVAMYEEPPVSFSVVGISK